MDAHAFFPKKRGKRERPGPIPRISFARGTAITLPATPGERRGSRAKAEKTLKKERTQD